jgi:PAT family acetyl-CoA transporter-like MFS transporter 1
LYINADSVAFSLRRNVGHASTCNSVGQTAGYFLGYVIFVGLESAEFCNAYLRRDPLPHGIVTLPGSANNFQI